MTAHSDIEAIIDTVNKGGIHRYLSKPWNDEDLPVQVRQALKQYELVVENQRLRALTKDQNEELKELNLRLEEKVALSRGQVIEMKVLDLNSLLRDLDKMLRWLIGKNIELVTRLTDDLGSVKADAGRIGQVILNLAVNARDAMPSGGKLTIDTANVEVDEVFARAHIGVSPGRYVRLSVRDTGVGMTPEVKERVFEPFFTTKEKG